MPLHFEDIQTVENHVYHIPDIRTAIIAVSIYTLSDLGVLTNLIGSLSLANEHYSPPTE